MTYTVLRSIENKIERIASAFETIAQPLKDKEDNSRHELSMQIFNALDNFENLFRIYGEGNESDEIIDTAREKLYDLIDKV